MQDKPLQVGQVGQLRRQLARQVVLGQVKPLQAGQVAQLRRNPARQVVRLQVKPPQVGQVAQLGRDLARQVVPVQVDSAHSSLVVRLDPIPVPQRRVGHPVVLGGPIRTVGRVVQALQDVAVRQRRAFDAGARMRRDRLQPFAERRLGWSADSRVVVSKCPQGQAGHGHRKTTAKLAVAADSQLPEGLQRRERPRQNAGQAVSAQVQRDDAARGIRLDSVPVAQRPRLKPSVRRCPARSPSQTVQGLEQVSVRLVAERAVVVDCLGKVHELLGPGRAETEATASPLHALQVGQVGEPRGQHACQAVVIQVYSH